ncbi:MAG TPA: malto-oligosyltrehalose synthase, partial [Methylomirabilota bacterium]|nr:malto-oligosyltrehalose synthase [Methylomirabilota bacterium]
MIDVGVLFQQAVAALGRERHATYRLQLGSTLGFDAVAGLAPYLDALGVSDAYLSPCFRCGPGSSHGYDVTDHNAFNPEVGSAATFDRMAAELASRGLGVILDVVPNHMGIAGDANPWWLDVLENGPASPRAAFFDIDWTPIKPELRDRVLLPILPDQYGSVLESQQLRLELADGAFHLRYAGARLPIAPDTYAQVLTDRLDVLSDRLGPEDPGLQELRSILTALEHLPGRTEVDPHRTEERLREKEIVKRRLGALVKESSEIREHLEETVRAFNGVRGDPASFDALDRLLSAQTYRLADWRVAGDEVNYRRFFDVSHLAAIRMEQRAVFDAAHGLVLRLVGEGKVTGLRVDHPDGLYAPGEYFRRLQEGALLATARRLVPELGAAEAEALGALYRARALERAEAHEARPLWIAAEKILSPGETLPDWWAVAGTTGYDFLASVNGLFVDRGASRQVTTLYARIVGASGSMADHTYAAKRLIMQVSMASEINQLGQHLDSMSERNRLSRDFTLYSLVRAIREVVAAFSVYRTYVGDDGPDPSPRDRAYIEEAVAEAKRRNPTVNVSIFDFVRDVLLVRGPDPDEQAARRHFAMRFQQTTGPVTAKGVEDTAFYVYNRLVSLNEVGGDPARYGESPAVFHDKNAARLARWPESLVATATHDTKRGEDVRARINVLSEVPAAWAAEVRRWRALNRRFKTDVEGRAAPDANDEYLLYQTLVGAWPAHEEDGDLAALQPRLIAYMEKATKEAKRHTSWVNPSAAYDAAVREFVAGLLAPGGAFLDAFLPFQRRVAAHGAVNSLAQVLLKIAAPGIPDLYQGTELWDFSLVDPDNRRPVDFAHRRALLDALQARLPADEASAADLTGLCAELLAHWTDGRVKLYLTHRALTLRRRRRRLFAAGEYRALAPAGRHGDHVIALARLDGPEPGTVPSAVIVAVPRLTARLAGLTGRFALGDAAWEQTWVTLGDDRLAGVYRDRFTGLRVRSERHDGGAALPVPALFGHFPVALLER